MRSATRPISARSIAWSTGGDIDAAWRERRARVNRFCRYNPAMTSFLAWAGELRMAMRGLWNAKAFSGAAVLTLAIGIGGACLILALVQGVLLRPLPVRDEDRLIVAWNEVRSSGYAPRTVRRRGHRDRGRDEPPVRGGGWRDDPRRRAMGRRRRAHFGVGERRAGHRTLLRGAGRGPRARAHAHRAGRRRGCRTGRGDQPPAVAGPLRRRRRRRRPAAQHHRAIVRDCRRDAARARLPARRRGVAHDRIGAARRDLRHCRPPGGRPRRPFAPRRHRGSGCLRAHLAW